MFEALSPNFFSPSTTSLGRMEDQYALSTIVRDFDINDFISASLSLITTRFDKMVDQHRLVLARRPKWHLYFNVT